MKNIIFLLILAAGFTSCMTQKPTSSGFRNYGKNNIKVVENPYYKKTLNAVGKVSLLGSLVSGTVAGLTLQPTINYNANNERTTNTIMNGIIGASVGFGITSIYQTFKGQGKKTPVYNENEFRRWLEKYNQRKIGKEYAYTGFTNSTGYLVLYRDKQTENNFIVQSVEDAIMFKNVFPYSSRMKEIEYYAYFSIRNYNDAMLFQRNFPQSPYTAHITKQIEEERKKCTCPPSNVDMNAVTNIALFGANIFCLFNKDYPNFCKFVSCYTQYKIGQADEKSPLSNPFVAATAVELIATFVESKKNNTDGTWKQITDKSGNIIRSGLTDTFLINPLKEHLEKKGYKQLVDLYDVYTLINCILSK